MATLLLTAGLVALAGPRPAGAQQSSCFAMAATIVGSGFIAGTPGNDAIVGSAGRRDGHRQRWGGG